MKKRNKKLFVGGVIGFLLSLIVCVMVPFNRKDAVVNVSIDDVEYSFKNLYENPEYTSVFQQPFFAYLRDCHLKYNCTFTLYVYANMGGQSDKFKKEFEKNSDWLRFGFHAIRPKFNKQETADYAKFITAFLRVDSVLTYSVGETTKASTLRLHYYYATPSEVEFLRKHGIKRLLTSDDERVSYSLPSKLNDKVIKANSIAYAGMNFRRTNLRMERMNFLPVDLRMTPNDTIVFFTHESQLQSKRGKLRFSYCLWFFNKQNCKFKFI